MSWWWPSNSFILNVKPWNNKSGSTFPFTLLIFWLFFERSEDLVIFTSFPLLPSASKLSVNVTFWCPIMLLVSVRSATISPSSLKPILKPPEPPVRWWLTWWGLLWWFGTWCPPTVCPLRAWVSRCPFSAWVLKEWPSNCSPFIRWCPFNCGRCDVGFTNPKWWPVKNEKN